MVVVCHRTPGQKGQLGPGPESHQDWCSRPRPGSASHTPAAAPCLSHAPRLRGRSFPFPSSHLLHFPLSTHRSAAFASQTCRWRKLLVTCLSASSQDRQTAVNPESKLPQGESDWPSLGQYPSWPNSLWLGLEDAGSERTGSCPAPWNWEPFSGGEGRLWRRQASPKLPQVCIFWESRGTSSKRSSRS